MPTDETNIWHWVISCWRFTSFDERGTGKHLNLCQNTVNHEVNSTGVYWLLIKLRINRCVSGSNIPSYAGSGGAGSGGQLDLSVSSGNRSFQQQQQQQHQTSNSPYGPDSGMARFGGGGGYEEGDPAPPHPYYNTNSRPTAALPPPLGMYEQNYRNCYQNNASMTAAAVAAAAYNYHYQQQQLQQQQQQQETDSSYDRAPYDYGRNRYLFWQIWVETYVCVGMRGSRHYNFLYITLV